MTPPDELLGAEAMPSPGLVAELGGAAAAIDAGAEAAERTAVQPDTQAGVQPAPVDWNAEAHDLVDFTSGMFFPLYPRLASVWTPERCTTLEKRLAAVLAKHNLSMGVLLGKWGPEIMLVAAIAPAVPGTIKAVKEDLAELRAKRKEQERAAPPSGQAAAQPPAAVRTHVQDAAAPMGSATPPPPDRTQLHAQA